MCQKSTSDKLVLLVMPGQCSSPTLHRGAQELPAPPSFCQACSTVENFISLSLGRFPDGTDLINCFFSPLSMHMLFLLVVLLFFLCLCLAGVICLLARYTYIALFSSYSRLFYCYVLTHCMNIPQCIFPFSF